MSLDNTESRSEELFWIDFVLRQNKKTGNIKIIGDTEDELLKKGLFSVGDTFRVDEKGVLVKLHA